MLVELGADVDGGGLDGVEEQFCREENEKRVMLSGCICEGRIGMMDINSPAMPGCSTSTRCGWNMHSGPSKRSEPTLMTRPSGS